MLTGLLSKQMIRLLVAIGVLVITIALILFATWPWPWWRPPRINVVRSQYEQAFAKWQGVEEYEISTNTRAFFDRTLTLHVSEHGNKVEELAPTVRTFDTLTKDDIHYLKTQTVEGLLASIDLILKDKQVTQNGEVFTDGDLYLTYDVSFDPQ